MPTESAYEIARDRTLKRLQRCVEARRAALAEGKTDEEAHEIAKSIWNEWAREMLSARKSLEAADKFKAQTVLIGKWHDIPPREGKHLIVTENDDTALWYDESETYFDDEQELSCRFDGYVFPGVVRFGVKISNALSFKQAVFNERLVAVYTIFENEMNFKEATFKSKCEFDGVVFSKSCAFEEAIFEESAWFNRAKFPRGCVFSNCCFRSSVHFFMARFGERDGAAWFEKTTFSGYAFFSRAHFQFTAAFSGAKFEGPAFFLQTMFMEYSNFGSCRFGEAAVFTSVHAHKYFNLAGATFLLVPKFNQANFKEAPDLDEVTYPLPNWRMGDKSEVASYRHIRRLALLNQDYENESRAFKGEIRSRRGTVDKPWHAAFWLGLTYDTLSDFGRSMMRPFYIWLLSLVAFAGFYFLNAGVKASDWKSTCMGNDVSKILKALTLSASNALPVIGSSRVEDAKAFYACVGVLPEQIPAWSPIIQMSQTLWSAVLIFLFLLAVRNQFKIK